MMREKIGGKQTIFRGDEKWENTSFPMEFMWNTNQERERVNIFNLLEFIISKWIKSFTATKTLIVLFMSTFITNYSQCFYCTAVSRSVTD